MSEHAKLWVILLGTVLAVAAGSVWLPSEQPDSQPGAPSQAVDFPSIGASVYTTGDGGACVHRDAYRQMVQAVRNGNRQAVRHLMERLACFSPETGLKGTVLDVSVRERWVKVRLRRNGETMVVYMTPKGVI